MSTKLQELENEQCWVILGSRFGSCWFGRFHFLSTGDPNEVAFAAEDVFERQDLKNDVIGFVHTHPYTDAYPSATDHATMKAWVTALGKPLVCGIIGTDGLKSYVYEDDESDPVSSRIFKLGNFICGANPFV